MAFVDDLFRSQNGAREIEMKPFERNERKTNEKNRFTRINNNVLHQTTATPVFWAAAAGYVRFRFRGRGADGAAGNQWKWTCVCSAHT